MDHIGCAGCAEALAPIKISSCNSCNSIVYDVSSDTAKLFFRRRINPPIHKMHIAFEHAIAGDLDFK